jgi:hypothetical protein
MFVADKRVSRGARASVVGSGEGLRQSPASPSWAVSPRGSYTAPATPSLTSPVPRSSKTCVNDNDVAPREERVCDVRAVLRALSVVAAAITVRLLLLLCPLLQLLLLVMLLPLLLLVVVVVLLLSESPPRPPPRPHGISPLAASASGRSPTGSQAAAARRLSGVGAPDVRRRASASPRRSVVGGVQSSVVAVPPESPPVPSATPTLSLTLSKVCAFTHCFCITMYGSFRTHGSLCGWSCHLPLSHSNPYTSPLHFALLYHVRSVCRCAISYVATWGPR